MWRKVNPKCFRLKNTVSWDSICYASNKNIADVVHEDIKIRKFLKSKLPDSWIARIVISRTWTKIMIDIETSKPWVIIWRQGSQVEDLKKQLDMKFNRIFELNIKEIKKPDLEAEVVAENLTSAIEKRIAYRRASKQAISRTMEAWALGVKIHVWWRLNGVEIARWEFLKEGNIPLHTIRSDISYATAEAHTTYWIIWVKVWIYRWQVFNKWK